MNSGTPSGGSVATNNVRTRDPGRSEGRKTAPGSPEDVKSAKSMWRMVRVAMEQRLIFCNEAETQA
jgi:hypothetical protein